MNHAASSLLATHPGTVSIRVTTFDGHVLFDHNPDRAYPAASTIKLPLLLHALQGVQQGRLSPEERIELREHDRVPGSGVLHELNAGLSLTLRDLLTLMIIVSDNTATNLIIEQLGIDRVNAFLRSQGLEHTELIGLLQLPPERRNSRQRSGETNRTTARDLSRLLQRLVNGEVLPPALSAVALDILSRQQLRDIVGRGLPRDARGELLYRVASKSGELMGVHHDVGLVWTPRPLIVVVLSEGGGDPREHPENREVTLLGRLAGELIAVLGDIPPHLRGLQ